MTLSELVHGVHRVTLPSNGNNVYLVLGKRAAFVDSGDGTDEDTDKIVSLWRSLESPHVDLIILTHRHYDHVGGASRLANLTGGRVASSFAEKPHIDQFSSSEVVQHVFEHGDLIDLDGALLEILLTPGHTVGSISIMYHEEKVLFTGDTILGDSNTTIMCDQGDMELYLNSVYCKVLPTNLLLTTPLIFLLSIVNIPKKNHPTKNNIGQNTTNNIHIYGCLKYNCFNCSPYKLANQHIK